MFLRTFIITYFLLISCILNAQTYPDYLLHRSYAEQFYGVDSLFTKLTEGDSSSVRQQIAQLEKWADDHGDLQLKYAIIIKEYVFPFRSVGIMRKNIESGLPELINTLIEKRMPELQAQALHELAQHYWLNPKKYNEAFELALLAYNIYSKFSSEQFPLKYNYLYNLGLGYYRFKDYDDALPIFIETKNTKTGYRHPVFYDLLNTIGLCYRRSGAYDSAEYYFKAAYDLAKQENKPAWIGITGGNLGITYYLEKRYKEAIPLLEYDIKTGLEHNKMNNNAANSIAILGDVYLELNDKKKGMALLLQAYQMVIDGGKWNRYELLETVYPLMSKAYALNGDYRLAYNFSDSATRVSDSSAAEKSALILASVQQKVNNDKHLADVQKHKRELKLQVMIWIFLLVSITSLLVAIFFIMRNYNNQKKTNILLSREKKRSEDLLLNILPSEVADELKDKGTAAAKYFDHVTVMFTDFVNFTEASETMNPQQLIDELHTCFKAFDEIIGKYNIEKIKTIGDAYLAVSGLPVEDPLHAEHILRAAMDINEFIRKRQQRMGDKTFQVRIGINSGSVVAGIVGVIKFAYDIWGDTVNIAARMEQSSEPGKINIAQNTYELVKDKFKCVHRGQIFAKNKGDLNMYFVEGVLTEDMPVHRKDN